MAIQRYLATRDVRAARRVLLISLLSDMLVASMLVLLGIAMPLKYVAGMPGAVKVVGWAHGVLFVVFCYALMVAAGHRRWPLRQTAIVFIAALIPFGPFVIDKRLKAEEEAGGHTPSDGG